MASAPIIDDPASVIRFPSVPPMPAVARILSRFDRPTVEAFLAVAIDLLDTLDGDTDREGECSEDEVSRCTDLGLPVPKDGAGCDIADTGENAWIEWHTMHASQKRGPNITQAHEDAEDDDPAGQYDEDCWTGPRLPDRGAGCPLSDPGGYDEGY